ncbi:sugar ABC transporter substrate-binding protein [Fervidicella metallireducens AeB]|uniref:Sugar ABC transporter substrate-binding protein n=1 Tax=Fervidicella metallireducens AeB TaxID=1403537 RepID=A0A017RWC4_9CLOT|nr:substrate-binding domain-containing protein [Fervidicella metallireducens]EYE88704.1 sugar ABC transporter substrate-binding protein [Fervidicella metallireducens AeB]
MKLLKALFRLLYKHAISLLLLMITIAGIILIWIDNKDIKNVTSRPLYHFYFIVQNSVDPFWNEAIKGAEESAKDNNAVIEVCRPRFNDPQEELKYIDIATLSRVDGIITHVSSTADFTGVIDRAYYKGIPVITLENDDSMSKRYAFVGTNSYEIGKKAAELLIRATGGRANIAVISSNDSNQGSIEYGLKMNGFLSTIRPFPEMKVINSYTSQMGILSAEEITQKIINSKDNINAIFTVNSADTLGAAQFIVDRNKVGKIILVGYGSSEEILRYIDKEIIYGTVASDPYKMGYESLKTMIDVKCGKNVPTFIDTEVRVITKDDLLKSKKKEFMENKY